MCSRAIPNSSDDKSHRPLKGVSGLAFPFFPSSNPLPPFGEGFTPPPTPPPGPGRGGREALERPRWPKTAPRGPQRAQDGLQDGPTYLKMAQDSLRHASKRLQDGSKTVSSALRALQGPPQEAKMAPKPKENQCFLPSRLFASDGLLRPQDGPMMAQEGPKRGPREAQDGPKSVQQRPKSGPRGPQEATFRAPTGGP